MDIIILLTPFHLRQISQVANDLRINPNHVLVFHSPFVDEHSIRDIFPKVTLKEIPKGKVSFDFFLKNPFENISYLRKLFRNYEKSILRVLKLSKIEKIVLFSDKDIFTQIFLNILKKASIKLEVIAVEEGIGYYIKNNLKDRVLNIMYTSFSKLLFGYQFSYIRTLGTHPQIDKVYARLIEELPLRSPQKKYIPIIHNSQKNHLTQKNLKSVLVITTPLSEDGIFSSQKEIELLKKTFEVIEGKNYEICIKQHPRENSSKLEKLYLKNYSLLNQSLTSEQLNYFDYTYIINFGSSSVVDMILSGYPQNRIITINAVKNIDKLGFFSKTNVINYKTFDDLPLL